MQRVEKQVATTRKIQLSSPLKRRSKECVRTEERRVAGSERVSRFWVKKWGLRRKEKGERQREFRESRVSGEKWMKIMKCRIGDAELSKFKWENSLKRWWHYFNQWHWAWPHGHQARPPNSRPTMKKFIQKSKLIPGPKLLTSNNSGPDIYLNVRICLDPN